MLRPSFASLSLGTFPPRGRLFYRLVQRLPLLGFPFGEAPPERRWRRKACFSFLFENLPFKKFSNKGLLIYRLIYSLCVPPAARQSLSRTRALSAYNIRGLSRNPADTAVLRSPRSCADIYTVCSPPYPPRCLKNYPGDTRARPRRRARFSRPLSPRSSPQ